MNLPPSISNQQTNESKAVCLKDNQEWTWKTGDNIVQLLKFNVILNTFAYNTTDNGKKMLKNTFWIYF